MGEPNRVLVKLLERLRNGLLDGPGINCRPHNSRQRIDLQQLEKLGVRPAARMLYDLIGPQASATATLTVLANSPSDAKADETPADAPAAARLRRADANDPYRQQQTFLRKLKALVDDARVYEQDTGADVLHLGFPLLNIPKAAARGQAGTRRLLAPIALIPLALNLKTGARNTLEMSCREDTIDRVVPNPSLLMWLEQSGQQVPDDLFKDEAGADPWQEIRGLTAWVAKVFGIPLPDVFQSPTLPPLDSFVLTAAPRGDDLNEPSILSSAVLGLFPINNQSLLRDMEAMAGGEQLDGPVRSFVDVDQTLDAAPHEYPAALPAEDGRPSALSDQSAADERLVCAADPCQADAVRRARTLAGLVVHGPPGTGKSQTIANIVGDHLLRGQRVLVVSDKRTALDVVADRLAHLGLGPLIAVVHDPLRDQRELYRSVREQLENLADVGTDAKAERALGRADRDLDALRSELVEAWTVLHAPHGPDEATFSELMGRWLKIALSDQALEVYAKALGGPPVEYAELEKHGRDLHDVFDKAESVGFSTNPWSQCAGISLEHFLARSGAEVRGALTACQSAAAVADASIAEEIPPFHAEVPLDEQVRARTTIATLIEYLSGSANTAVVNHWVSAERVDQQIARKRLAQAAPIEQVVRRIPLDPELSALWVRNLPQPVDLARQLGSLDRYLTATTVLEQLLSLRWRWESSKLVREYALTAGRASAERLHAFLKSCQARWAVHALLESLTKGSVKPPDSMTDDDRELIGALDAHHRILELLGRTDDETPLAPLRPAVLDALRSPADSARLVDGLRKSGQRAEAIGRFEVELHRSGLFRQSWLKRVHEQLCQGKRAAGAIEHLLVALASCETVVRIHDSVEKLPSGIREVTTELLRQGLAGDECRAILEKMSHERSIRARLAACPELARLDGQRLTGAVTRYRELRGQKHDMVCAAVIHRWTELQKQRLMASTRSRLNADGADLRRRLTLQGNRALRLRKVVEIGREIAGGDPLFDLRPVWMASPETVAQVFPRLPMFDVIVFDEASQCRLEEALPVLTRGRRVVIAGDTKQLPPTRFFETALVTSEDDRAESQQDWFELQQSEVEDLLSAALNLQIEQSYLDVHYRSHNADLIGFSNLQFYASRLQAIPGHPRNRTRFAPISLYHARGVYEERTNRSEAEAVCKLVHDLLRRAEPPSIGIACFNTDQRDLIVDCLDERAQADSDFAARLAGARARKGTAASEALFVKNLENVQGDERDHLIISTTYGPNAEGRFYRRFGPLGRTGGGRRLNVLVTRAKQEVHLVTSIPPEVYRDLPQLAPGQTPNGGWLLFSYLQYAERLAELYAASNAQLDGRDQASGGRPLALLPPEVTVRDVRAPSAFAEALAQQLAREQRLRSTVPWGNDGFCVDVAIGHPNYEEDVTIGLLCDFNRYHRAADPIAWEIFRTEILQATGWQLERIWTPQFFRDSTSVIHSVMQSVKEHLANEDEKDALRAG